MSNGHGIISPWNVLANKRSSSFNNAIYGDLTAISDSLTHAPGCLPDQSQLTALSQQLNPTTSPSGSFLCPCNSYGKAFEDPRDQASLLCDLQRQSEESQTMNNIHKAMNALTLTNSHHIQPSFSDLSPLASQTPTTPWSATAPTANAFPYTNPFSSISAEHLGTPELLSFLQGLQTRPLTQTPRSLTDELTTGSDTFRCSWSNDLINLAQMVSTEMQEESAFCSSISDGAIYANQHLPPVFSEQRNGRVWDPGLLLEKLFEISYSWTSLWHCDISNSGVFLFFCLLLMEGQQQRLKVNRFTQFRCFYFCNSCSETICLLNDLYNLFLSILPLLVRNFFQHL